MRYFIIAGEASGDLHGSNLIKSLLQVDTAADIYFWGGDLMQAQGGHLLQHYKETSFMGFVEVAKNIKTIWGLFRKCKAQITELVPDVIIYIDYPGFNLRMAKWSSDRLIKSVYYISPQIWAWKASRIELLKKCIDKIFVILPFEPAYYKDRDVEVSYHGHPLIEVKNNYKADPSFSKKYEDTKVIALLPGSRKQEIKNHLPLMSSLGEAFPDYTFVVAARTSIEHSFYKKYSTASKNVKFESDSTYDLLQIASYAIVASGTATLECAIFNVPQIVVYKGNTLSYSIAKRIIKVEYISLVNLIADREIVKELIQSEFTKVNLIKELKKLESESKPISSYTEMISKLGKGVTSINVAKEIFATFLS